MDAFDSSGVWPLADQTVAGVLFQDLQFFRQSIERDYHELLGLDVVEVLAHGSKISFRSTKERPTAGKEKRVQIGVPSQIILHDLDRLGCAVLAWESLTG